MSYCVPSGDNLSTFSLLKQIDQIPQNLLLARVKSRTCIKLEQMVLKSCGVATRNQRWMWSSDGCGAAVDQIYGSATTEIDEGLGT